MDPLRVDMVILEYHPIVGGAQKQLALLAPLLRAQEIELRVLTRRYPGLPRREIIDGVPVYRLPAPPPRAAAATFFSLAAAWAMWRRPPDVIHAYSLLSPLLAATAVHTLSGVPVVAKVLRGGHLGDITRVRRKRLGPQRLDWYRRRVAAFIAISREIDGELAAMGVAPDGRVFLPNGVDVDRFRPPSPAEKTARRAQLGLLEGPLAIFTGRLVPEKRLDLLVRLWPAVRARHPEATLLLLGDGPDEAALRAQAGPGVRWGGRVDDVAPYLQAADIFVLPSAGEGLSNALLEAMACGLPVVATAVGGAPDVIAHGDSGLLVPTADPAALTDAILSLLADAGRREALGRRARAIVVADFALPAIATRLRALYDRVRAERSPRNA